MKIYRLEGSMNIVDINKNPVTGMDLFEAMKQYNGDIGIVPLYNQENILKDKILEYVEAIQVLNDELQKYKDFEEKRANSFIGKVEKFFGIYLII
jgi:hypothetical protein